MIDFQDKPSPRGYRYDLAVVKGRLEDADIKKLRDVESPRTLILNVFNGWDGDLSSVIAALSDVKCVSLDIFGASNSNFNINDFATMSEKARESIQHMRLAGQFVGNLCLDLFPNLSDFGMVFTSKGKNGTKIEWGKCQNLKALGGAWPFFPSMDILSKMPKLHRIESVRPGCTPESLCEIVGLEYIDFAYWNKLSSFTQLGALKCSLKHLELSLASRLDDYESISILSKLQYLSLHKCPPIPRGAIFSSLKEIETLYLIATKVIDRDMTCLYSLPDLKKIALVDQKNLLPSRDVLYEHFG